ncbi:carboxypeptidase-like regulatory domain-containing protein [Dysgonomonas sp. 25]|uniref:carboxypeptidase-like regulatory domain-containing protein n=1 Tax=Dysgonomonas sp. 25 TaxID=2302933 RepID=UPI0013CF42DA|nr:carboxypeptidase-like regulatory domain-containing protein [Dysgonomonas sp. 25]NDV69651.1 carboxypeptidase-like regulatory domain-containing protein [Dysgonomonas sp. 25]
MNRLLIFCLFLIISFSSYAQILTGKVYDTDTKKPLQDVDVYFDGTSIHTTTDKEGVFKIPIYTLMTTNLIISHLSYELAVFPSPFNEIPEIIYLKKEYQRLSEVTVLPDIFSRKEKLAIFRKYFLGKDKAGKACKIINEDDIHIYYDESEKELKAVSDKPLIIENNYLGYRVVFDIQEFTLKFSWKNTLNEKFLKWSYLSGKSMFSNFETINDKIEKRRKEAYMSSTNYFYKNLVENGLKGTKYELFRNGLPISSEKCFIIKDTLSMKMLEIIPNDLIAEERIDLSSFKVKQPYLRVTVLLDQHGRQQSDIVFNADKILVDAFGNTTQFDKIIYSGLWGGQKVGCMLPLDYRLEE